MRLINGLPTMRLRALAGSLLPSSAQVPSICGSHRDISARVVQPNGRVVSGRPGAAVPRGSGFGSALQEIKRNARPNTVVRQLLPRDRGSATSGKKVGVQCGS